MSPPFKPAKNGHKDSENIRYFEEHCFAQKKRYVEEGLPSALFDKSRPGQPIKYTEKHVAEVIALACSSSPDGSKRWSLSLLTEELRKKEDLKQ